MLQQKYVTLKDVVLIYVWLEMLRRINSMH